MAPAKPVWGAKVMLTVLPDSAVPLTSPPLVSGVVMAGAAGATVSIVQSPSVTGPLVRPPATDSISSACTPSASALVATVKRPSAEAMAEPTTAVWPPTVSRTSTVVPGSAAPMTVMTGTFVRRSLVLAPVSSETAKTLGVSGVPVIATEKGVVPVAAPSSAVSVKASVASAARALIARASGR